MGTWLRVLIGGGIGLLGAGLYFAFRLHIETAKNPGWDDIITMTAIGAVGLLLAVVADRILEPVSVAVWLRWTFVGVAAATGIACVVTLFRADKLLLGDGARIALYFGGLVLLLLAFQVFLAEVSN
jgi:hypothetical protein